MITVPWEDCFNPLLTKIFMQQNQMEISHHTKDPTAVLLDKE